jgi:micrococcal nuclease
MKRWHVHVAVGCAVGLLAPSLGGCSNDAASLTVERAEQSSPPGGGAASSGRDDAGTPEQVAAGLVGPGAVQGNARVVHLSDGDTLTVRFSDGGEEKVRLIGIDTPETKRPNTPIQCFGPEASRFLAAAAPAGTDVRVERDVEERDRYGRLLGYVYRATDGLFLNRELALQGYANLLTFPPNVAHVDEFTAAVQVARDEQRGLWRACPTTVGS